VLARAAARCRPSPRVATLPAQRHELQRYWPLLRVGALAAITASCSIVGHCRRSELQRSAGLAIAASCNAMSASPQRCVARSCSATSPHAIAVAATEFCSSDVCPTCIRRLSDFRSTSVQLPSDVRPTFVRWSCVLRPTSCYLDILCTVSYVLSSCALTYCVLHYCSPTFYALWSCILWSCVL